MKEIELTQNQVAIVDDDDFEYLSNYSWCCTFQKNTNSYYAHRTIYSPKKTIYMSREIMKAKDGVLVDHINHDTLDNRKSNLRIATVSQNMMNRKTPKNNKSGIKGVVKQGGKFLALIRKDGVRHYLGSFSSAEEAKKVYENKSNELFGQFKNKE